MNLRRKIAILLFIALSLFAMLAFASCGDDETPSGESTQSSAQAGENTDTNNPEEKPEEKTYTVTFVQEGFEDIVIEVKEGEALTDIPSPQAEDGYNVAWEDIDLSNITADVIINALKTIKSYTITFDSNGGTQVPAQSVGMYQKATEPDEPTRPGYVFDGWYYGKEKWSFVGFVVTEDMTLVAKWIPNENTLMFDANGGEGTMENITVATDVKVNLTANAFTKAGYTFVGWSTAPDGEVEYTDGAEYTMGAESSYTLYAVWQVNINGVVFDANGSEGEMQGLELATGTTVTLPANTFTKAGYTFLGWSTTKGGEVEYTDGAEYTMGTESSYTLYAVWQANENSLVFNANGGEGTMENITVATDVKVNLTANAFTKAGYTFLGWSTTPDGEVEYTDGAEYTMGTESSYTLYAVWQINTNTLSFNSNGGSGTMSNVSVVSFSTTNLPANKFTRTGYTFLGWSTTKGGAVEYTDGAEYIMGAESSYTLYAVWEIDIYTLTYHNDGSENVVEFTVNDLPITLNDLANKTDYLFDGWYNTSDFSGLIITRITTVGNVDLYAKYVLGTDGLVFTNDSGSWTISGYTGSSTSVVIPSFYKGKAVTSIASSAFKNCTSLTSVEIGDSVTSIGEGAFSGCGSLVSLTIPFVGGSANATEASTSTLFGYIFGTSRYTGGVSTEQHYAFGSYKTYYIPESLKTLTVTGGNILYGAFYGCSLTSVDIGNGVTSIGKYAFNACTALTSVHIDDIASWCNISFGNLLSNPLYYAEKLYLNGELVTDLVIPNTVDKINSYAFYNCTSLTSVEIGDSVTSIGSGVFCGCDSLTSVEIPNSVTSIGSSAFSNCTSLTSVEIGDSVTSIGYSAFENCTSLTNVEIPDSVTSIGSDAFYKCTSLTSVEIGDSVTSIGNYAFDSCTSLTSVHIDDIVSWCNISFGNTLANPLYYAKKLYLNGELVTDLVIPNTVDKINSCAFSGCTSLTSVVIGDSVTSIGDSAFEYCTSLTSVDIGNGVTSIGKYAFDSCTSLTSVEIGDSVTSIGERAFYNCTSLTSVEIGDSVTSIGAFAFYGCTSLTSVVIGDGVTSIGERAFYNCTSLTSVDIGDGVISIGSNIFSGCGSLESITVPFVGESANATEASASTLFGYIFGTSSYTGGVSTKQYYAYSSYITYYIPKSLKTVTITGGNILYGAFYGCSSLTSVEIGDGVTSIGDSAFYNCKSLTSVEIGNGVTSIGDSAFYNCTSLTSVEIGDSVTSIDTSAFYNCTSLTSVHISDIARWCNISLGGYYANPLYYAEKLYLNGELVTDLVIPNTVAEINSNAFYNCTSLTSVEIGDSVTIIGSNAFYKCTSLTSVEIGDSVTSIGYEAFRNCTSLTSVHIDDIASWCNISFDGSYANPLYYAKKLYLNGELVTDLVIPNTVDKINSYAFYNCTSLTSVEIGEGVTSIGIRAFYYCTSLTSVEIGDSVTSIGNYAFEYCTSLTSVVIGDSVTSIGERAFYNCTSLTSVEIGDSVTSIGSYAFRDCTSLTSVHIDDIASWCNISFDGFYANPLYYAKKLYLNGELVTDLVIPNTVAEIKNYAFSGYTSLTSVEIGDSVTSIGDEAFRNCTSLTSVEIPNSVTSIGSNPFYGCTSLTIYCEASRKPSGWSSSWNYSGCSVVWGYKG